MTREAFERLLSCLSPDREQAAQIYEEIRLKLTTFFEFRGCLFPQEQVDVTINRVARRILEGEMIRAADVGRYFCGVARNVLREYWKDKQRETVLLRGLPQISHVPEAPDEVSEREAEWIEREQRFECLEGCLRSLPEETRQLIVAYYQGEKGAQVRLRQALSEQLKISPTALRLRVSRIRANLDGCLTRCLGR